MSNKTYNKKHTIPIYDISFYVVINDSVKDCIENDKFLNQISGMFDRAEELIGSFVTLKNIDGNPGRNYIMLPYDTSLGNIVHETLHFIGWIGNHIGLTFSEDSEEAFAYLQGYIITLIEQDLIKATELRNEKK